MAPSSPTTSSMVDTPRSTRPEISGVGLFVTGTVTASSGWPSTSTLRMPGGSSAVSWAKMVGGTRVEIQIRIVTSAANRAFSTSTPPALASVDTNRPLRPYRYDTRPVSGACQSGRDFISQNGGLRRKGTFLIFVTEQGETASLAMRSLDWMRPMIPIELIVLACTPRYVVPIARP